MELILCYIYCFIGISDIQSLEITDGASDQSQPSGEENEEIFQRLSQLPIATGLTNGSHNGYREGSFDTASNFSVPSKLLHC